MREQFTFYRSFYDAISCIKNKSDKLACYEAIVQYAITGEMPSIDGVPAAVFALVKPHLDNAAKKSQAGKSASKTESNEEQNEIKTESNEEQNANKNKNKNKVKVKNNMLLTTTTTTISDAPASAPRLGEVCEFFRHECSADVPDAVEEARLFIAYNANRGWDCLPDWKSAAELWAVRSETR